jgi:anti-anti-sigma regulatory factor
MTVQIVEGLKFTIDRGPNWLFVKLPPRMNIKRDLPELAERLLSIASRHFIYRLVLELDEVSSMPDEMVTQLVRLHRRLVQMDGSLRLCGLSPACAAALREHDLDAELPNHETRQAAVLGCDVATLRQKLKEVAAGAGSDGAELVKTTASVRKEPCLQ